MLCTYGMEAKTATQIYSTASTTKMNTAFFLSATARSNAVFRTKTNYLNLFMETIVLSKHKAQII